MFEKIVQLNEKVIKGQLKEFVQGSVEETLNELLELLQESGCEVSRRGKSYLLKISGWDKVARLDSLGEGYTLEDLLTVLTGKKEHTPRQKLAMQADPPKVNLLVDIQAKLQAGKGAGYVRWAKVINLKQMAQTMNYLTEHNLLEYAVLEGKAAAAMAHHNELSARIKAAKNAFDDMGVKKLPKVRELQAEYAKLLEEKKLHAAFHVCTTMNENWVQGT